MDAAAEPADPIGAALDAFCARVIVPRGWKLTNSIVRRVEDHVRVDTTCALALSAPFARGFHKECSWRLDGDLDDCMEIALCRLTADYVKAGYRAPICIDGRSLFDMAKEAFSEDAAG